MPYAEILSLIVAGLLTIAIALVTICIVIITNDQKGK